jgi:hypothetical protein
LNKKLFVDSWINKLQAAGIKQFPAHFIDPDQLKTISIPIKTLVIGQEFFGSYEIITTEGESVYQASNYDEAKFFVYGSRQRNGKTYFPKDLSMIKNLVNEYNSYLDDVLYQINKDYRKYFPNEKDSHIVSNEIFQKLNLIRY